MAIDATAWVTNYKEEIFLGASNTQGKVWSASFCILVRHHTQTHKQIYVMYDISNSNHFLSIVGMVKPHSQYNCVPCCVWLLDECGHPPRHPHRPWHLAGTLHIHLLTCRHHSTCSSRFVTIIAHTHCAPPLLSSEAPLSFVLCV